MSTDMSQSIDRAFEHALRHHQAGRLTVAERAYRQILQREPAHADAIHLLGVIALQTGHFEPALALVQRAVDLRPDGAIYRNNLGQVLERLGRPEEAARAYEAAIELDPDYAEPLNNLGRIYEQRDEPASAEALYRKAIANNPDYAEPHSNLGNVLKDSGKLDEAIEHYRRAIELRPDLASLHSNLLLTLHYHAGHSPATLAQEHARYAARHVAPLGPERKIHTNDPTPDRPLRVGYVSPDFREHPVARFMQPLLEGHDRNAVEVFAYADVTRPDDVTAQLQARCDAWRDIANLDDAALAAMVRADGIDILVDLAAHSGRNRLLTFARKPAPVQVTYLAYCSTTGVDAIDYRLTDRYLDPPNADRSHYTERSVELPGCYWCYSAPPVSRDDVPTTTRETGPPTFGCLNNFAKVTDVTLALWARLLHNAPDARLLLHAPPGSHRDRVRELFRREGLPESRLSFVGRQPLAAYLDTYRRIDVALDPFPYTGGTTTCDALWMGVPVVSLAGATAVSRSGASLLSHAGLGELVGHSEDDYVRLAVNLLQDRDRLAELRLELRPRLEASVVMDASAFVRGLEAAFRQMWRAWCRDHGARNRDGS